MHRIEKLFVEIEDGLVNEFLFRGLEEFDETNLHPGLVCADNVSRDLAEVSPGQLIKILRNQSFLKRLFNVFAEDNEKRVELIFKVRLTSDIRDMLGSAENVRKISVDADTFSSFLGTFLPTPLKSVRIR
jgi:hypothetical protein